MKIVLAALVIGAAFPLHAQAPRTVAGVVRDAQDGRPLSGVAVGADAGGAFVTGPGGTFRVRLPGRGEWITAAGLGYAPATVRVPAGAGEVEILLQRAPLVLEPLAVRADRPFSAASSAVVRALDVQLRPLDSSQELLRLAPGVVIAQHAGGGKAEQIFARGFDADHGTDVAVSVDGVPVNVVSHAHGQGYADLHFLIPETVERVDVRKGPYDARDGDFATAASVAFRTRDHVEPVVSVRGGSFGTGRVLVLAPLGGGERGSGGYVAAAVQGARGPFEAPQHYRRVNAAARWTAPVGRGAQAWASALAFAARWDASGQVPERAVRVGAITRFGAIDPTEGGETERHGVQAGLRSGSGPREWEVGVYLTRYRLRLFSNFTFFLADSVNGDGIEQRDDRWTGGAALSRTVPRSLLGRPGTLAMGAGARADRAEVGLHGQRARARLGTRVRSDVDQGSAFGWVEQRLTLGRARVLVGARADAYHFGVADRRDDTGAPDLPRPHGVRRAAILSPRASLAFDARPGTTLFANFGTGFHSNDARDAVLAGPGERILPRALGYEAGARHTWPAGSLALAAWSLELQSELVYVGDEGVTESSGRTRRRGLDAEARLRLLPWLWADADVSLSRGRFRDEPAGADRIPLAPPRVSTGGLTARDAGPWTGGLRYRHVAARPADETGTVVARGHTIWEVFASRAFRGVDVRVAIDNLTDAEWNEAQFATTSRLMGEAQAVTELHFTPGAPRSVQLGVDWRF